MTEQDKQSAKQNAYTDSISEAIANAVKMTSDASQTMTSIADQVKNSTTAMGEIFGSMMHQFVEQGTKTVGEAVMPIAENPYVKYAKKLPGINWLMAALGQVDEEKVQQEVDELKQKYPLDTEEELAHRIIVDSAFKAAGIGLATNIVPPVALTLFALDLGAVAALQAEMIYRIAAAYGFSLTDPARRGEVLAIWGLSTGGSGVLKTGLSFVEVIPLVGPAIGISTNATLLYSLGRIASQFYQTKRQKEAERMKDENEDLIS